MIQFRKYSKIRSLMAIALLGLGANGYLQLSAITQHGADAKATVTKKYKGYFNIPGRQLPGGSFQLPHLEFTFNDAAGGVHTLTKVFPDKELKNLSEGDSFEVLYDKAHPDNVIAKARLKRETVLFEILGVIGLMILAFELFAIKSRSASRTALRR